LKIALVVALLTILPLRVRLPAFPGVVREAPLSRLKLTGVVSAGIEIKDPAFAICEGTPAEAPVAP
jgi:hypothetical protein